MTSNYVVYFHSYFQYLAVHFSVFTAKMFLIFIQDTSVLTGTEVRRVGNPINASQEEFLWSLVAPVDIFHQDFVTKSITPTCRLGGQTALRTNRVRPLSQSFQNKSAWRWTKTSAAGLWNALLVVLLSFLVMTDDLRIITRLLKLLLFFYFHSDVLLWASRGPAAWGSHAAVCGGELKGFTLHHFKPHFQPPYCCLCAAGDGSSFINYISSLRRLLGNLEDSDIKFYFLVLSQTEAGRKLIVFWRNWGVIPLWLNKGKIHLFFCIWLQYR